MSALNTTNDRWIMSILNTFDDRWSLRCVDGLVPIFVHCDIRKKAHRAAFKNLQVPNLACQKYMLYIMKEYCFYKLKSNATTMIMPEELVNKFFPNLASSLPKTVNTPSFNSFAHLHDSPSFTTTMAIDLFNCGFKLHDGENQPLNMDSLNKRKIARRYVMNFKMEYSADNVRLLEQYADAFLQIQRKQIPFPKLNNRLLGNYWPIVLDKIFALFNSKPLCVMPTIIQDQMFGSFSMSMPQQILEVMVNISDHTLLDSTTLIYSHQVHVDSLDEKLVVPLKILNDQNFRDQALCDFISAFAVELYSIKTGMSKKQQPTQLSSCDQLSDYVKLAIAVVKDPIVAKAIWEIISEKRVWFEDKAKIESEVMSIVMANKNQVLNAFKTQILLDKLKRL